VLSTSRYVAFSRCGFACQASAGSDNGW